MQKIHRNRQSHTCYDAFNILKCSRLEVFNILPHLPSLGDVWFVVDVWGIQRVQTFLTLQWLYRISWKLVSVTAVRWFACLSWVVFRQQLCSMVFITSGSRLQEREFSPKNRKHFWKILLCTKFRWKDVPDSHLIFHICPDRHFPICRCCSIWIYCKQAKYSPISSSLYF